MRMPGRPVGLERVKQLRRERPMSQDELAGAARLSLRTIQGIEGEGIASSESKKALAAVFGVQPETFNDVLTSREVAAAVVDHLCSPRNQFLSDRTLTLVRNGDESTRTTTRVRCCRSFRSARLREPAKAIAPPLAPPATNVGFGPSVARRKSKARVARSPTRST